MGLCRQVLKIIVTTLIAGLIISACGSGESDDPYAPREISKEHEGLSLSELEAIASDISYNELIGHPGEGIFFDVRNRSIIDNVEKHDGTLIYWEGFIEVVFPSKDKSRETIWLCPTMEQPPDESSVVIVRVAQTTDDRFNCKESLFLLYDVNRGPALTKGDVVQVAGVIVGGQKKSTVMGSSLSDQSISYHPTVSVIKVKRLGVSEWQPQQAVR